MGRNKQANKCRKTQGSKSKQKNGLYRGVRYYLIINHVSRVGSGKKYVVYRHYYQHNNTNYY